MAETKAPRGWRGWPRSFGNRFSDIGRALWTCRFFIGTWVVVTFGLNWADQGRDLLRRYGEGGGAEGTWGSATLVLATSLWGLVSWHTCRALLTLEPPEASNLRKGFRTWFPRVALLLAHGTVAVALWRASVPRAWLAVMISGVVLSTGVLFRRAFVTVRGQSRDFTRQSLLADIDLETGLQGSELARLLLWVVFTAALIFFTTRHQGAISARIGTASLLLLAAAAWVSLGSGLAHFSLVTRLPAFAVLVLWAGAMSLCMDNHPVRTVRHPGPEVSDCVELDAGVGPPEGRLNVEDAFRAWRNTAPTVDGAQPLVLVTASGGGIRAAYWTALVLGRLNDDTNGRFAQSTFALSTVSGGSLGAAVFAAQVADGQMAGSFVRNADAVLADDFLSPAIGLMLFGDTIQRAIPRGFECFDRELGLEAAWARSWCRNAHTRRFSEGLSRLHGRTWTPGLYLNSTSVERGSRVVLSSHDLQHPPSTDNARTNVPSVEASDSGVIANGRVPPGMPEVEDLLSTIGDDVPLSSAVAQSSRFPYVSPAGTALRINGTKVHLVDGGYFENSGAATLRGVLQRLKHARLLDGVRVLVLQIENGPLPIEPLKMGETRLLLEAAAPPDAFLASRDARGVKELADLEAELQQRGELVRVSLMAPSEKANGKFPLGWTLSAAARKAMCERLAANANELQRVRMTLGITGKGTDWCPGAQ